MRETYNEHISKWICNIMSDNNKYYKNISELSGYSMTVANITLVDRECLIFWLATSVIKSYIWKYCFPNVSLSITKNEGRENISQSLNQFLTSDIVLRAFQSSCIFFPSLAPSLFSRIVCISSTAGLSYTFFLGDGLHI